MLIILMVVIVLILFLSSTYQDSYRIKKIHGLFYVVEKQNYLGFWVNVYSIYEDRLGKDCELMDEFKHGTSIFIKPSYSTHEEAHDAMMSLIEYQEEKK